MAKAKFDFKERTFTPVDGKVLNVEDYFHEKDFVSETNGHGVFVKHDALLRVCKELFQIRSRDVNIVKVENQFAAATVRYTVIPKDNEVTSYSFESAADVTKYNNAQAPADRYFTAMAETRASGRALRFLLGVDFCTKEEIGAPTQEYIDDEPISENVKNMIEKKFMGEYGVNLDQIRLLLKKNEKQMPSLSSLTVGEGAELLQKLHRNLEKLVKEE